MQSRDDDGRQTGFGKGALQSLVLCQGPVQNTLCLRVGRCALLRYCMTPWVLRLNDLTPQLAGRLPCTDTRLRPDVRCLELGIYDQVLVPLGLSSFNLFSSPVSGNVGLSTALFRATEHKARGCRASDFCS